jgi:hypothetical protein
MSWSGRPALKGFVDGSRRVIESADLDGADRVEEGGQHRDRQSLWLALPSARLSAVPPGHPRLTAAPIVSRLLTHHISLIETGPLSTLPLR